MAENPFDKNSINQIDQQLRQLAKLKEHGLITEEQFNAKKQSLLASASQKPQEIWNPAALANWSLLFTPLFGAFLQAKNWESLGNRAEAKKAMVWFYFGVAVLLSVFLNFGVALTAYVILLLSWYFISNRKQQKYVKEHFGSAYPRKGWGMPLAIGLIASVAWQIAVSQVIQNSNLTLFSLAQRTRSTVGPTSEQKGSNIESSPQQPLADFTGEYVRENAAVDVKQNGKAIDFSINSVVGQHPCNLEGTAVLIDANRAAYTPKDKSDKCVAILKFVFGGLTVMTKDCEGYCGLNAAGSMDGNYKIGVGKK